MARTRTQQRLAKLLAIAKKLPELDITGEEHLKFQVRRKTIAYYLDDHHGDGRVALCCKVNPLEQAELIELEPERYFMPAYIGHRGFIGLRLDLPKIDWEEVSELLRDAYCIQAPRKLAQSLEEG